MSDWKEKIEAQIARASDYKQCDREGVFCQLSRQAQDELLVSVKALLDVAVAAEKMADFIVDYDGCDGGVWREFWAALDKLREASDE